MVLVITEAMCKAPIKSSPSNEPILSFLQARALPVAKPTVQRCQSTEVKKYHIPWTCFQTHLSQLLNAPVTLGRMQSPSSALLMLAPQ